MEQRNAHSTFMPKVNMEKDLKQLQIDLVKRIEKENLERVNALKKIRRGNISTGFILGGTVLGIYLYSIIAVKQENFLDDLEEEKKS